MRRLFLFGRLVHGFQALGADVELAAGNALGLQVDMLAFGGFDVGVGAGSVFGRFAAA